MIYGSQSYVGDYDYFDGKHEDMAVVDLDASFTNDNTFQKNKKELPCIPNEQMYIRILNVRNCWLPYLLLVAKKLENQQLRQSLW